MNYVVPQFIEVESKIIGPISVRQFIELLVTAGLCFVWYSLFTPFIAIPLLFITGAIGGGLTFAKVNSQPMHYVLLNLIQTFRRPPVRIWMRTEYKEKKMEKEEVIVKVQPKERPDSSSLASMALLVDTGGAYTGAVQTNDTVATTSTTSMTGASTDEQPLNEQQ